MKILPLLLIGAAAFALTAKKATGTPKGIVGDTSVITASPFAPGWNPIWMPLLSVPAPSEFSSDVTPLPNFIQDTPRVPGVTFDARDATEIIQRTNNNVDDMILAESPGGTFPRIVGTVTVENPNQLEHLKHAIEDARFRANRGY